MGLFGKDVLSTLKDAAGGKMSIVYQAVSRAPVHEVGGLFRRHEKRLEEIIKIIHEIVNGHPHHGRHDVLRYARKKGYTDIVKLLESDMAASAPTPPSRPPSVTSRVLARILGR